MLFFVGRDHVEEHALMYEWLFYFIYCILFWFREFWRNDESMHIGLEFDITLKFFVDFLIIFQRIKSKEEASNLQIHYLNQVFEFSFQNFPDFVKLIRCKEIYVLLEVVFKANFFKHISIKVVIRVLAHGNHKIIQISFSLVAQYYWANWNKAIIYLKEFWLEIYSPFK